MENERRELLDGGDAQQEDPPAIYAHMPGEFFDYNATAIERGDLKKQKELLSMDRFDGFLHSGVYGVLLILACVFQESEPYSPYCLSCFVWIVFTGSAYCLAHLMKAISAWKAYRKPELLLNGRWHRNQYHLFEAYVTVFLVGVMLSLTLPGLDYVWEPIGMEFREDEQATYIEWMICILTGFAQLLAFTLAVAISCAICCMKRKKKRVDEKANAILKELEDTKIQKKWSSYLKKPEHLRASITECPICLGEFVVDYSEFEGDQAIVELKCHKNHLFHFGCLESYLKRLETGNSVKAKCPLCQQDMEFVR